MKAFFVLLVILLVIAAVIFGPLLTIWALNTLFGLTIGYSLKTWFAIVCLAGVFNGSSHNWSK